MEELIRNNFIICLAILVLGVVAFLVLNALIRKNSRKIDEFTGHLLKRIEELEGNEDE